MKKKDVVKIVTDYINDKNRSFTLIDPEEKIEFEKDKSIPFGKYEEQIKDVFSLCYEDEGYYGPLLYFVFVCAESGEVLYTMSEHGYVEISEENANS